MLRLGCESSSNMPSCMEIATVHLEFIPLVSSELLANDARVSSASTTMPATPAISSASQSRSSICRLYCGPSNGRNQPQPSETTRYELLRLELDRTIKVSGILGKIANETHAPLVRAMAVTAILRYV